MKSYLTAALTIAVILAFASVCPAATTAGDKPAEGKAAAEVKADTAGKKADEKPLTKEELLPRITALLQAHPDIIGSVAGLEAKKEGETAFYLYKGKRLEELDANTLLGIMRAINQFLSLKSIQQTQRQMQNLKQLEDINRTQRMVRQQQAAKPYSPPKVYKASTPPKTK